MSNKRLNRKHNCQTISLLLVFYLLPLATIVHGQTNKKERVQTKTSFIYKKLVTPNPSVESQALFRYLQNISGEKILSGQMCTPRGINEVEYIYNITGKKPALRGINFDNSRTNEQEIENIIKWWQEGGIPLIMWNWGAPAVGNSYESSRKKIDIDKCFQEGTPEYDAFWQDLSEKANHLEALRDTNVPVLWNPFHEQNGEQFWWGKQGPAGFQKLWQTMFNYFVHERKLNNLIWVSNLTNDVNKAWIPDNNYVDIVGISSAGYDTKSHSNLFNNVRKISENVTRPLVFQQCATIPSPNHCRENGTMWCWWMQRPSSYLQDIDQKLLSEVYHHNIIVTQNEVPDIVECFSAETVKRDFKSGTIIPFSELKGYGIGTKLNEIEINTKRLKITSKGKGIKGKKDETYFSFKQFSGDFDVSTEVVSITPTQTPSTAGLMARVDLSKGSQHVFFALLSSTKNTKHRIGGYQLIYRDKKSNETKYILANPQVQQYEDEDYPNIWIRLKRRGSIFKSYISHDNSNWQIFSVHQQKMPERLLVGLAVSSNSSPTNTIAEFKDLEITWE